MFTLFCIIAIFLIIYFFTEGWKHAAKSIQRKLDERTNKFDEKHPFISGCCIWGVFEIIMALLECLF